MKRTLTELVDRFVIKAVNSGVLKIGTTAETATAWAAGTNDIVDASHQAYWTPAANANGTLNAFTAVAKDNGGAESTTAIQATVAITAINDAPTLTAFTSSVASGNEDSQITVTLANLQAQGDEADVDGIVDRFVIKAINSGVLKIGTTAETATAWAAGANEVVDASHQAYWTPAANTNGTLNAFTAVAKDNGGLESAIAIQATVAVTAVNNDAPTLTTFTSAVASGDEDSQITVTFANLQAQGDEADVDGIVDRFVIKAVNSGVLKIGTSVETATAWAADSNDVVDASHQAYWTPAANANGTLNAFTVVAKDTGGAESATAIQATVAVTAVNDGPPVLTTPTAINYTDTDFDDTFATAIGSLDARDIDSDHLTYGITDGTDNGDGTIIKTGTYGVLMVNETTGAYSFAANDAAIEALTVAASTSFTVTVSDGSTLSYSKSLAILAINIAQNGKTESHGNDNLTGTPGNDIFDGLKGADTIKGGLGDDTYTVDNARDVVTERARAGTDTVNSSISYTLKANIENLTLTGTDAINGTGNALNNVLSGNAGANILNGGAGADSLIGDSGNDVYIVDNVRDVVTETSTLTTEIDTVKSSKSFILAANVENLTLTGTAAINGTGNELNNVLTGNKRFNELRAGAGDDIMDGGLGKDVLTGGDGQDIFQLLNRSKDTITDFSVIDDTIQLENSVFTKLTATGVLNADNFKIGAAATDVNDYVIYNNDTGALFYDANGSGAGGATQIAVLGINLALTYADFFVI